MNILLNEEGHSKNSSLINLHLELLNHHSFCRVSKKAVWTRLPLFGQGCHFNNKKRITFEQKI